LVNLCKNLITIDNHNSSRFDQEEIKSICNYQYIGQNSHDVGLFEMIQEKMGQVDVLFIDDY
jgi:hypothetical protein